MGIADQLKRSLGGRDEEEEDDSILASMSASTTLSWGTRIKGFIACFILGVILSVLGSIVLFFQNYVAFAVLYSLGTLVSLSSTMFLMGPLKQLKRMADPTRIVCTIILIICIALTIMAAVWWHNAGLAILFCILQFLALAWYSISYIPFARDAVKKCFTSCCAD